MKESGYLDTPYLGHQGTISWPHNLSMRLLPLPLLPSHSQKFLPGWLLCFFSYFPDSTSSLYPCEVGPSLLQLKKLSQSYSHLLAQPKTATETQSLGHTCSESGNINLVKIVSHSKLNRACLYFQCDHHLF